MAVKSHISVAVGILETTSVKKVLGRVFQNKQKIGGECMKSDKH